MKIICLPENRCVDGNPKVQKRINKLLFIIEALNQKQLPVETVRMLNDTISTLLDIDPRERGYSRAMYKVLVKVLEIVREKHQIVTKNYYRNYWMPIGMSVFGLPIGVAIGIAVDNMGYMGAMLPIGLVLGMAYGGQLDKKAIEENRVIDIEVEV